MPHYACRVCDDLFDPTQSVRCPHCNEKNPLECSKCGKEINHHDIYGIEKLRTKKPLLCMECGHTTEVIKCGICKTSLVRSQGVTVSKSPRAKVYHKRCYDKQLETVEMARKVAPAMAIAGLLGGYFGFGLTVGGAAMMAILAGVGWMSVQLLANFITPK